MSRAPATLSSLIGTVETVRKARQVLIYQCILDLTGKSSEYNYSKAAHFYPPFSHIPSSAKNYKIALALTLSLKCLGEIMYSTHTYVLNHSSYKVLAPKMNKVFSSNYTATIKHLKKTIFGEKLYLSPILDLHGSCLVSYTISERPVLHMVTSMLDKALSTIPNGSNLILHSD